VNLRDATAGDARDLAILINLAGEGLPDYLWRQMAGPGESPLSIGARRAAREEGSFSYRNARILEIDDAVAGMVLSYLLPDPYDLGEPDDYPAVVRPLVELEARVPGSWYVNAIATYEEFRGRGVASALMSACEDMGNAAGAPKLSLIVASENEGARALYGKLGYREIDARPLMTYPGGPNGGTWLLMLKDLQ
jgi:ribosomal protein S18 acetylase RimI-like enzyme